MRDKYGVAQDRYCYPNSDVLKNLLDIREPSELEEAEASFSAARAKDYIAPHLTLSDFTLPHPVLPFGEKAYAILRVRLATVIAVQYITRVVFNKIYNIKVVFIL